MSFFGSSAATSTPAKPVGLFSTSFGAPSTPAQGFGASAAAPAPMFGVPSGAPAFGATGFGAPAATTAPTMGSFSGFGAPTATAAPAIGSGGTFGMNIATSSAPTLFGAATSTANSVFGGFGAPAATSAVPTFSSFGTTVNSGVGTGFGSFGSTSTTSAAPTFGGFGTQSTGFGGGSSLGTSFGKPATSTVTPGFGGFGGTTNFMLGQPQQQAPQVTPVEAFAQSIFNVSIYGDERDTLIAKWNYLQAMWGTGKSFYSQNAPPVEISSENYLCRFKAMGYTRLPGKENKLGLVALNFVKPLSELRLQQQQIINTLHAIFGNKPNLTIKEEYSKELDDKKSQIVFYVEEKLQQITPNQTKRILATDVANYLNQPNVKMQLQNMGVLEAVALILPDEDQLNEYLETPPKGIDPRMWKQAKLDNPDPEKFIPAPMIGFNDLKCRIRYQEQETEMHAMYLRKVERDLTELRQRHAAATAKIMEHKRKLAELSHMILKIIVKQECTRKMGMTLTPEEEALRTKLDNMQALVSAPTQFKGRLSELLSQMRMQRNQYAQSGVSEYTIDKECEEEMKAFLAMQQKAIEVLTDTVTKDFKALQIITEGMPDLVRS